MGIRTWDMGYRTGYGTEFGAKLLYALNVYNVCLLNGELNFCILCKFSKTYCGGLRGEIMVTGEEKHFRQDF